jgi:phage shock protein A
MATKSQLVETVEFLENQNEQLLDQVGRLEGIRGALEEKVSAYRDRLKELTVRLEEFHVSSTEKEVVYYNKDNLERRRFVLQRRPSTECLASEEQAEIDYLEEKYARLLEHYMYEREKNERLTKGVSKNNESTVLEFFTKAEAADTLLKAATVSRKMIQRAEEHARQIESNV